MNAVGGDRPGGDLEAEKYVDGRWGHQSRGQRKRLIEAFKAGVKRERNRPSPSRPEDRGAVEDLGSCAYLRGVGSCSFGCHSEPACITERPSGGWPSEPPPRDPAGEGEEVCVAVFDGEECGGPRDSLAHPPDGIHPGTEPWLMFHDYQPPARPSSPTGETPCACEEYWPGQGHHPECPNCQPTGETPCATCGYPDEDVMHYPPFSDESDHHPYQPAAVPAPPTVGPEAAVEEAWTRIGDLGHGDVHWRNEARDIDAIVPLAVEQAIRADGGAWWKARYIEAAAADESARARAESAEAQVEGLRAAHKHDIGNVGGGIKARVMRALRSLDQGNQPDVRASLDDIERLVGELDGRAARALAGESTEGRE